MRVLLYSSALLQSYKFIVYSTGMILYMCLGMVALLWENDYSLLYSPEYISALEIGPQKDRAAG